MTDVAPSRRTRGSRSRWMAEAFLNERGTAQVGVSEAGVSMNTRQ